MAHPVGVVVDGDGLAAKGLPSARDGGGEGDVFIGIGGGGGCGDRGDRLGLR